MSAHSRLTTLDFVITKTVGTQTDGLARDGVYQCLIRQSWTFASFVVAESKVCSLGNSATNCTFGLMEKGVAVTNECGRWSSIDLKVLYLSATTRLRCAAPSNSTNRISNAGAAEHFTAEREIIFTLIGKPRQVEAITANFENQPAKFEDFG